MMGIHAQIGLLNRYEIECEIERLIEMLDVADAPFEDLEEGSEAEAVNEDGVGDLSPLLPAYALDQSTGPTNEREGYRAWQRSLR